MASDWSDYVPEPRIVFYGCTPWVPEREHVHAIKAPNGGFKATKARGKCPWCKGNPRAAGHMCPGCHRMPVWAETKLGRQRARAAGELARKAKAKFRPKLPTAKKRREKAA